MLVLPSLLTGRAGRRLWQFHGGIHLPDEKALSNGAPVQDCPLPAELVIPLQQHIGGPARPCVLVGDRVLKGQVIGEPQGYISAPVHASTSGTVRAIEPRPIAHPSGLTALCVVLAPDGRDEWIELPPPLPHYTDVEPAQLRERIRQCGIVGMGGASFPTPVKLNPGRDQPINTLVINAVECEPYITCDDLLMRERAADVISGVAILRHILTTDWGAPTCLIGIEDNKPEAIAALRSALAGYPAAGKGGIEVVVIPTLYPSGGEKQLIRVLTGREVPRHGIPAQIGVVCQNVGTAVAVADAVLRGQPLLERLVTVTGRAVARPGNFRVRVGTPAAHLLAAAGGLAAAPVRQVAGGPMMGINLEHLDVPVTKAFNCLLSLTAPEAPDAGEALACIRCGRCAEVCPVSLLPQQLYWHARAKDLEKAQDYHLFDCIECGCCAVVCPSHIPLVQYYRYAKTETWAREKEKRAAERARTRHAAREARLERQERERKARLRQKQAALESPPTGTAADGAAPDPKQAAIAEARARAAASRAARAATRRAGAAAGSGAGAGTGAGTGAATVDAGGPAG